MPQRILFHCLFFLLTASTLLRGQTDTIGEWQTLQSYRYGTNVTESPNSIIYTTGRAIFFLDKEDLSITRLAREDGLDQARIRLVRYHRPTETLIVVYENSVIDLLNKGRFSTLRQIDNFSFSGDKKINEIFFGENNLIYLAAGYGISALDLNDETFVFTTFTGVAVNATAIHAGLLYGATDEGIYRVPLSGVNLNDFGNWELLVGRQGFPGDYSSKTINVYKDQLYFGIDFDIYRMQADTATLFYDYVDEDDWEPRYLTANGSQWLIAGYRCPNNRCRNQQILFFDENGFREELRAFCTFRTNYAIEDESGRIWLAETEKVENIRYIESIDDRDCIELEYGGPLDDENFRLLHDGRALWVAPGPLDENFSPSFNFDGVYRFQDGEWTIYNRRTTEVFKGRDGADQGDDDFGTIVDVHYDAVNNRHWFSSFFEGAIRFDAETGEGEIFDETNSGLQLADMAGDGRVRVAGAVTDAAGFTYLAVSRAEEGGILAVHSPEGEWATLGQNCNENLALAIELDDNGFIWIAHTDGGSGGITVIDPMGTPLDPSDDRCRTITSSNSALPNNSIRSLVVDLDNNVWVGTTEGITLFECGTTVFDPEFCSGRQPIVEANGFGGFLLETEEIRSITVDGGNRKWIGTNSGAYLLSPDGREQLLFFDEGNSPLLDNLVRDIAIDPNTGTVYFGTELGIISFRGEATVASRSFREDLVVFPNPVEPGYAGPIAINGLARDARVKITDVSGKLVAEGTAIGGQFVWEGTDYNGRRVTTGVYLVFASTNGRFGLNNPDTAVGKVVFLR